MYNHKEIEKKWQAYWEQNNTFRCENDFLKPKYYTLDMFPYPSGAGLHVGHPEGYTANDILARYKHANGFNVLHPMGWDAFGLPAENYAIKTGTHPRITTDQNISTFKSQIKRLGFSYDWEREVDTTDPKYYKWTQWIFLKLFEKGLAYEQDLPINYCPSCKTGLANEEVLNDFTCERCGTKVEKKKIRQWVLAITKYADRLAQDVDKLDWPEGIKDMQRNWIGKSKGCNVDWKVGGKEDIILGTYTTTVDTIYGVTFAVISPEHPELKNIITSENKNEVQKYIDHANHKSDLERTELNKDKTGVFTGAYLIHPFNGNKIPLYVADYVLMSYGTGVVMGVPAHDQRDKEFAEKYDIEIIQSVELDSGETFVYDDVDKYNIKGKIINSGDFTGLNILEGRESIIKTLSDRGEGEIKVQYKLRDWLFSRQRYWGEPIPLIHLEKADMKQLPHISDISEATDNSLAYILKRAPKEGEDCEGTTCGGKVRELIIGGKVFSKIHDGLYGKIVCDYRLPLELPEVDEYEPAGDGSSPLAKVDSFVNVKLAENLTGKRETNTMPQWGGSCWYYLRYMDNMNDDMIVDPEVVRYWGEVDSYVGGAEHAVLHLLYARFWHKFLYDIDVVPTDEPFYRLRNQGLILAHAFQRKNGGLLANDLVEEKDGKYFEIETGNEVDRIVSKMSKSLKNVVNPDDIVEEYGADSLRLYEMYMAEFKDTAPWDSKGIVGVRRFLDRVERLFSEEKRVSKESDEFTQKLLHKTIKKVGEDIENYKFNTAIAQMIILINNGLPKEGEIEFKNIFLKVLHPFAPHLAEELWESLGNKESIFFASWPEYDEKMTIDDTITIGVQVLGKLRGTIEINKDEEKDSVLTKAKENTDVAKWLEGKNLVKEIYVPGKIVNLVVK